MRDILFRGFHPDENGTEKVFVHGEWIKGFWVYGYYVKAELLNKNGYEYFIIEEQADGTQYEVIPETVGQYTGLKDKNGKGIFEGDIVKNDWCFMKGNSVVKLGKYKSLDMSEDYPQGHLGFYLKHIDKWGSKTGRKDILFFANNCEVIGNGYSNPELLEMGE